ncbi:P-II family nitrogen regulator [Acidithiobacillus ferriphilus]|jgi:nitrogen regulatory protein PII|uniref:P-II family nitrogen regulator n=1 Tax=Acidithiobacillus TaxID=119977 RepID=UPI001CDCC7F5|nr:P-II family nitrogen regulator [Acidithiobacillus sp.]MDA8246918.1 P-II family nitrogen regulator [Acidithiobacillus sp.]UBU63698.1 P-II family nitrogen regulator [Acidithiobacillus ferrooxidans]
MKRIAAIIRPFKLDDVSDALAGIGIRGMTVTEVTGFEQSKGHFQVYRGHAYASDYIPKIKIEVVISDERLDDTLAAVIQGARTGKVGDGKIFVTGVSEVIRIRTGEMGDDACNPPFYGEVSAS